MASVFRNRSGHFFATDDRVNPEWCQVLNVTNIRVPHDSMLMAGLRNLDEKCRTKPSHVNKVTATENVCRILTTCTTVVITPVGNHFPSVMCM